ncbi:MAG: cytochrome c biogenesis protein CcsA [Planctomycetes bacterium]|nr:cytochrome c biogenesis protein CcsA [Planctomycetota bacterium]
MIRSFSTFVLAASFVVGLAAQSDSQRLRTAPWSPEVQRAFAELPVQDGGRVKPLDTVLQFALYRIQHKRKVHVPDEARFGFLAKTSLTPIEWGLDLMLYPEASNIVPAFTLEDSDVLTVIGIGDVEKRKRDRYSYAELEPGIQELVEKASEYHAIDTKKRTLLQGQIVGLANAVREYQGLSRALDFARARYVLPEGPVRELFDGAVEVRTSDVLRKMAPLIRLFQTERDDAGVREFADDVDEIVKVSHHLAWIPPSVDSHEEWLSVSDLFEMSFSGIATGDQIECVERFEDVTDALGTPGEFDAAVFALHAKLSSLTKARGEFDKIPGEVSYYRADFFGWALVLFLGGFVVLAFGWLAPRARWLATGSTLFAWAGEVALVWGITDRCILRERPPITGLYDTILFITGIVVLAALVQEAINRRRIGLMVANVLGAAGMFLSFAHEVSSGTDTMDPLMAVLDTNFWLATHVTTVTIGYAAGLLAAGLSYVFLLGKLFGLRKGDRAFYHQIGRMIYGSIGFGIVFSTVGTILGGVWANDSWGRFWGWDPKENGALLIVLWFLIVLHARLGGYIRHYGVALLSVLGGAVVAFSWWGVNLLGVGLHSYGFTSGVQNALVAYYGLSVLVFALGIVAWARERAETAAAQPPAVS